MRILIIEDNDSLVKLLKHTLEGAGHETFFASAGDDGLKKVEKLRPDLLLLDLTLPKIDGLDVSRIINSNPNKYGKPMVMIMTGKTSINDVKAGFETGAVDYIKKPFDPEEIVCKISALTKLKDKESALIVFFDLEIDQENFKIYDKENELKLTKKEYEMLIYIIKNKSDYYRLLQEVRTENKWEEWIIWMLKGVEETAKDTIVVVNNIKLLSPI